MERGLLVTRFHYTNPVHPKLAIVTGMTRDGTFYVEDGRIVGPVRNLRFTQSYLEALAATSAREPRAAHAEGRLRRRPRPGDPGRQLELHGRHGALIRGAEACRVDRRGLHPRGDGRRPGRPPARDPLGGARRPGRRRRAASTALAVITRADRAGRPHPAPRPPRRRGRHRPRRRPVPPRRRGAGRGRWRRRVHPGRCRPRPRQPRRRAAADRGRLRDDEALAALPRAEPGAGHGGRRCRSPR